MKRVILALLFALCGGAQAANTPPAPPPVQTLGTALRMNAGTANLSNPIINPWWTVPAAWAGATAYTIGAEVINSGHVYEQLNASCTSAGSGGPTAITSVPIADNNCSWTYNGEPPISSSDTQAPTLAIASGADAGTTVLWSPPSFPALYQVRGATTSVFSTNYWNFTAYNNKANNAIAYGFSVCTDVTDRKFSIYAANGSQPYGVTIDGRYYSIQSITPASGSPNHATFDFSGTTGYRTRSVCINSIKSAPNFGGIATTASGFIAAPKPQLKAVSAVWLFDSYDAGSSYGPFAANSTMGNVVSSQLGWMYAGFGQGGTGLQNPGSSCSGACYTYIQRVQDVGNAATIATASVVVFNVSTNDASYSNEQTAVTALLTAIRAVNKNCVIIGIGPAPINTGATYAQTQALDAAGAAAFAAFNDPAGANMLFYVPWANAPNSSYTNASYMSGQPANANSTGTLLSNGDNVHPTNLGVIANGKWLASQIRLLVLPNVR